MHQRFQVLHVHLALKCKMDSSDKNVHRSYGSQVETNHEHSVFFSFPQEETRPPSHSRNMHCLSGAPRAREGESGHGLLEDVHVRWVHGRTQSALRMVGAVPTLPSGAAPGCSALLWGCVPRASSAPPRPRIQTQELVRW